MSYLLLPFFLQGLLMGIDEGLHHRRDLKLWERFGHPLDTLTVFVTFSYIVINPYTEQNLVVFIILSVFSCFFITKDEFIHTEVCGPLEHWLHALLFVLHPLVFLCAGVLWKNDVSSGFLDYWSVLIGVFMIYQILRWSIPWRMILK